MQRREVLKHLALLAGASALSSLVRAQSADRYGVLPNPEPVAVPGKVEVLEFFSYACPHCNEFDPLLSGWVKDLPKDVNFLRVPVSFGRQQWADLTRLYYSLEAMGEVARLHGEVFSSLHHDRVPLFREDVRRKWLAGKGVDTSKFDAIFKSFGVQTKVQRAEQLVAAYKVDGVPEMAVGGRYTVSVPNDGFPAMLKTVDQLVARVRGELGKG